MSLVPLDAAGPAQGGKAAGLARLIAAGVRVPRGVVIGADVFEARAAVPVDFWPALRSAVEALGAGPLAVRSSALDEDGAEHSFAGQHDTVLGVEGFDAVVEAVRRCWASAFSERAVAYRAWVGAPPPRMAVIVQRLVEPRCAGVVFTRAPDGSGDVVIEAVSGRGEALVSGHARPDPDVLSPGQRQALEAEARRLEAHFGEPLDLEWALSPDGTLWWLQARPITTSISDDGAGIVWSNTNAGELLPDLATPMTLEFVRGVLKALFALFTEDLGIDWDRTPVIGLVGGRVYFSMNVFHALARSIPGMGSRNPAELFGGHAEEIVAGLKQVGVYEQTAPLVRVTGARLVRGVARLLWRMVRQSAVTPDAPVADITAETVRLAKADVAGLTDADLFVRLQHLNGDFGRPFHDVFAAITVGMSCTTAVLERCRRWLGDADGSKGSALLAGLGDIESAESGLALWRLGAALRAGGLGRVIERRDWSAMQAALNAAPELRAAWDEWMARFGHHARAELDVAQPRWGEAPEVVLGLLAAQRAGAATPAEVQERAAARRAAVEAEALSTLGPLRRRVFRWLLDRARRGTRLRERLKSESIRRLALARATLVELGRRLVARGVLERPDDVFFFRFVELRRAVDASDATDWKRKVARARRELERWRPLVPPPVVVGRLDPASALPPPVPDGVLLTGLAVSAGVVEGVARVVLRSDDDTKVGPGEILVAPFTDPGWAPWFVSAAGLVVELGGMLSHGSIIAREYGIPAVVNVAHATRRIRSGSRIRVDGFRGEVTILSEPA